MCARTHTHTHVSSAHVFVSVQLKRVEPENHVAFHTEHAHIHSSQSFTVGCGPWVTWGGGVEEGSGEETSDSWTGGNADSAGQECRAMNGLQSEIGREGFQCHFYSPSVGHKAVKLSHQIHLWVLSSAEWWDLSSLTPLITIWSIHLSHGRWLGDG